MKTYIEGIRDGDSFYIEIPKSEVFGTVELFGDVFTAYIGTVEISCVDGKPKRKLTVIEC